MARSEREALQSPVEQGEDEKRPYTFDFAPLGTATPSNPACVVYDVTDATAWADVTEDVLSGSATVAGSVVTAGMVGGLTRDHVYRLECQADGAGGSRYEGFVLIKATR